MTGNYKLKNATIHYSASPKVYTVSYDANGGMGAPASQTKTQQIALTLSNTCPVREMTSAGTYTVTLNNDGLPLLSGLRAERTTSYSFQAWNTAADGSGTSYAAGASYTADADLTLYAQWSSSTKTAAVTLPVLRRNGAVFRGWAEDGEAENGVTGAYTPRGNVTLYAIWLKADLVLPASLSAVEVEAFTGGAFTSVIIPETVTQIGGRAFAGCPKLRYAVFTGDETRIDSTAFDGVSALTIIAPSGSTAEAYARSHGFTFQPAA